MGEKKNFTCQNPSCKTTFSSPLKTLNLQDNPAEPYFACPVCLTKIEEAQVEIKMEPVQIRQEKDIHGKLGVFSVVEKPQECQFHMGYLSERVKKEEIPDDCLTCKNIVDCMLRKMQS
jgi:hypothetical protein